MDTNPQAEVSEGSIEDRLEAAFLAATEEPAEAPEEDKPAEVQAEAEEETQTEAAEDDAEEVEFEGKAYKVPKEIKGALLRQSDYTQKTQEVATLRRQAEDRAKFVEAKEAFVASVSEDLGEIRALEAQVKQFESLDWSALYSADPGQALKLRDQREDLARKVQEKKGELGKKAQAFQAAQESHQAKQWELAVDAARQRIGKLTPDEDLAMAQTVKALGFEDAEVRSKLADPRLLELVHMAAKWRALQNGQKLSDKKVTQAKPIKQVARSAPATMKAGQIQHIREQLKKTGREEYADAYFKARFG